MQMDGILGEMVITGIDKRSYQLLKLGELLDWKTDGVWAWED